MPVLEVILDWAAIVALLFCAIPAVYVAAMDYPRNGSAVVFYLLVGAAAIGAVLLIMKLNRRY